MWRAVGCQITNTEAPVCELGWWTRPPGVMYHRFEPFDPPEVHHTYGESLAALSAAIVRLEGLPKSEAAAGAEQRLYHEMLDFLGTSSERTRLRWRYGWKGW